MPINEHSAQQPLVAISRVLADSKAPLKSVIAAATETGAQHYDYSWAVNNWKWRDTFVVPPHQEVAKATLDEELKKHGIEPGLREEMRMRYDEYLRKFVIKDSDIPALPVKGRQTHRIKAAAVPLEITRPLAASKAPVEDLVVEAAIIGEDFMAHLACHEKNAQVNRPVSVGPDLPTRLQQLDRSMEKRHIESDTRSQVLANYEEQWKRVEQDLKAPRPRKDSPFSLS